MNRSAGDAAVNGTRMTSCTERPTAFGLSLGISSHVPAGAAAVPVAVHTHPSGPLPPGALFQTTSPAVQMSAGGAVADPPTGYVGPQAIARSACAVPLSL